MQQYYIHIGVHKTGSTFLQNVVFPDLPNTDFPSRQYFQLNPSMNKLQHADDTFYDETEVIKEIASFQNPKVILSDESFSGKPVNFNYINRSLIARRLASIVPNAKIIIFVRGQ